MSTARRRRATSSRRHSGPALATAAQDAWDELIVTVGGHTFHAEVASWYTGGNIEGKPRKLMMWVGGFDTYRQACAHVAGNGYEGFACGDTVDAP